MKHINKKIRLGGAGRSGLTLRESRGGKEPPASSKSKSKSKSGKKKNKKNHSKGPEIIPPVYLPPQLGQHQYGASHSYAETIDLLTDGPIEGIVNQNGLLCDGESILQGIYLNDTPVAVTNNGTLLGYHDLGSLSDPTGALHFDDTKLISGFFEELKGAPQLGGKWNPTYANSLFNFGVTWKSSNYMKVRNDIGSYKLFTHTRHGTWPQERTTSPVYTAPRIVGGRSPIGGQTIGLYTDDYTDYGGSDVSDSKFIFAFGNTKKWARSWGSTPTAAGGGRGHFYWTAYALVAENQRNGGVNHPKCNLRANILELYALWTQTDNPLQKELARRVLSRLGAGYPENATNLSGRVTDILNASSTRNCHLILRPDATQNGLAGMDIATGGELMNYTFKFLNSDGENVFSGVEGVKIYDFLCPEIGVDEKLTGTVKGFILIQFQWSGRAKGRVTAVGKKNSDWGRAFGVPAKINNALASISQIMYMRDLDANGMPTNLKYNYSNVLAEFRKGTEDQMPLKFFNKVFIDHVFDTPLYGPFKTNNKRAQSLAANRNMLASNWASSVSVDPNSGLPINEGSEDKRGRGRGSYDYANWAKDSLPDFEEEPLPITHVVVNPNVDSVFISLMVGQLHDTLHTQKRSVRYAKEGKLEPGAAFPSILNVAVTTGLIDANGKKTPHKTRNYRIVALIESSTLIDIGNPDGLEDAFSYVEPLGDSENIVTPIPLPKINQDTLKAHSDANQNQSMIITADKHIAIQRYVEVERLSTETNSVLISKNIDLQKITEIIPINLTYPFSTMVGTKLDSRSFDDIPVRSFDCKLKKVKVPSNYEPTLSNGMDKRYYLTQGEFDDRPKVYKEVYRGDWDGTFNEDLQWTDNPAWILYDLLTSTRYGLGQHVDENTINKWQLYEIGRFCDAVDDNGFFLGVPDGHGGREPRFSCNIVFDAENNIYDALNSIVGLFRGSIFFNNGEINFTDDRPRETVDLFSNDSVKDGMFHYANNRRDDSYNTIEVTYLDRFDSYVPKIEVVEDEEDIRQRGVFKKKISAIGITSRAMARRAAEHQIFHLTKENQTVAFEAGLETLLCQPGDLILIEDELKTLKENFGKILEVDVAGSDSAAQQGTIRLSNKFVDADMTGRLTVYLPTGRDTISEVDEIANQNRQRSLGFTITGDMAKPSITLFSGEYNFSKYTAGYADATGSGDSQFMQYALYTGTGMNRGAVDSEGASLANINTLYFSTGFTGWVLATGSGTTALTDHQNHAIFIQSGTGSTLYDLGTGFMNDYSTSHTDRRGQGDWASVSGLFSGNNILDSITRGFLPSEVMLTSPSQTTVLNVTGQITLKDYGCLVSGFDKPEFLPLLKLGSACKFEIKDASPFIYKVGGIREVNPNEFLVSASKYETGKWRLIEDNISVEYKQNTFAYNVAQTIGDITYSTLDPPKWTGIATGYGTEDNTFFISGDFTDPNGGPPIASSAATGFHTVLVGPGVYEEQTTITNDPPNGGFCVKFDNIDAIGVYTLNVNALGNQGATDGKEAYFNSSFDQTGVFVLFEEELAFGRSFAGEVQIG